MIGEDDPGPGRLIFQKTPLLVFHDKGGLALADAPVPSGPRNPGQLAVSALRIMATRHKTLFIAILQKWR